MNEKIKAHLTAYAKSKGWGTDDDTLMEILSEASDVFSEIVGSHRWYEDKFRVVNVDGMLIGFNDFHMTGDSSRSDMGLEFDLTSVCEVEKKQKTVDYYEEISA